MDCVVAPVDQRFPVREEEVSVIVEPAQKAEGPAIVGVAGSGFAVTTLAADVAVQPLAPVTVTVYEPADETVIDCVVAPVDQELPVAEDDVRVMLLPAQNELGPEIVGVAGAALTVATVVPARDVQPPTVIVTEYVPVASVVALAIVGFWRAELKAFGPVQEYVAPATVGVVRLRVPPAQIGPLLAAVGVAGIALTVAEVVPARDVQPATVTVTE